MYGVFARWNLSGVVGWTYSVGDADARRCPLTEGSSSSLHLRSSSSASPTKRARVLSPECEPHSVEVSWNTDPLPSAEEVGSTEESGI